ncbi:C-MYC-BINDING PROTEIN [Salix koriyanagi]|uniref:C-MYC-BINDING PROTEIN n=1 Tax=Salix koriyanagi TaxID=2511006 RepID=A0A9Q1A8A4_9ROSI|nr:C-MYC-BINDING PROTEIN [Salix koriyanagi]
MMRYKEEKEAKKEAFRKYLESGGVLDALTKVLVSLYEQNDKPSSAIEFIQQKLGGPSLSEYEKLQAEMSELQNKYADLLGDPSRNLQRVGGTQELPKCCIYYRDHKQGGTEGQALNILRKTWSTTMPNKHLFGQYHVIMRNQLYNVPNLLYPWNVVYSRIFFAYIMLLVNFFENTF